MLRRGTGVRAGLARDENGAAMAEYLPLLAVIALLVMFAVSFFGPWVGDQLVDAAVPLHGCPAPFRLVTPDDPLPPSVHGVDRDLNGDGYLCIQEVPGKGNGNTGVRYNVKDNNWKTPS
ncbi:MAG: hypothetical protein IH850_00350 [Acidobacteria bacterium]|nr:hypothetical protein [Acidobacteriota bacterium]